jgi:hypothetical protein
MAALPRREFIIQGGAAIAALTVLRATHLAHAYPGRPGDEVLP